MNSLLFEMQDEVLGWIDILSVLGLRVVCKTWKQLIDYKLRRGQYLITESDTRISCDDLESFGLECKRLITLNEEGFCIVIIYAFYPSDIKDHSSSLVVSVTHHQTGIITVSTDSDSGCSVIDSTEYVTLVTIDDVKYKLDRGIRGDGNENGGFKLISLNENDCIIRIVYDFDCWKFHLNLKDAAVTLYESLNIMDDKDWHVNIDGMDLANDDGWDQLINKCDDISESLMRMHYLITDKPSGRKYPKYMYRLVSAARLNIGYHRYSNSHDIQTLLNSKPDDFYLNGTLKINFDQKLYDESNNLDISDLFDETNYLHSFRYE